MFLRSFTALVGVLVTALTLATTAALATDEPAPTPAPTTHATSCVDNMRPLSRLKVGFKKELRKKGVIHGIAIDQGCGTNGAGKVKSVQVAIARKVGKKCQHLQANGRLGRATSCSHVWLKAKGKNAWSFRLSHRLPRGKYMIGTRAVDAAGNVEARAKR